MLPRSTIIVGGGIVGLTTAVVLSRAARGTDSGTEITVLERGELGTGSTLRAGCGLRPVYQYPVNVKLARAGLRLWRQSDERLTDPIDFRENGYLFLTDEQPSRQVLQREARRQHQYGFDSAYDDPPSPAHGELGLNYDNYSASLFASDAALSSPSQMIDALSETAREGGVQIHTETPVTNIDTSGRAVTIQTPNRGRLAADAVVNATGAWAGELAAMTGLELPVAPKRRRLSVLDRSVSPDQPLTVDIDTGVYLLADEAGVVHAGGHFGTDDTWDPDSPGAFSDALTDHWRARLRRRGGRLWDGLADARVTDGWTGLYAMTPSNRPIIDRQGDVVHATGFSGHGIMQAPGAARIIASLLAGERPSLCDPAALRHDRATQPPDIQF